MPLIITKYAVTALIIVIVSEFAKRSGRAGALISSLPLVSVMVMIWLHVENQDRSKIADYAYYTFWYVLPTLPMFLLMPALLRKGMAFWPCLGLGVFVTFACFCITAILVRWFSVQLLP